MWSVTVIIRDVAAVTFIAVSTIQVDVAAMQATEAAMWAIIAAVWSFIAHMSAT